MQSSPLLELVANTTLLANSAKWKPASMRNINIGIPGVYLVCQIINEQFDVKARPWQISVVVDIIKQNWDICAIADTNAGKSLVYQSIPIITSDSILVILPTIAFIEDQVYYDISHHYVGIKLTFE